MLFRSGALGGQRGAGLGMLGGGALGLGAGGYLGGNVGASIGKKKKPAATDNKEQKEDETDEKLAGILPANLLSRVGGMFRGKVAPAASALAKPVTAAPLASAAEAASKLPTHHMRPDELHKLFQQGVATQRGAALHHGARVQRRDLGCGGRRRFGLLATPGFEISRIERLAEGHGVIDGIIA